MEEKKIIKKYICPGVWMIAVSVLLAAALVVTLVMGVTVRNADPGEALEFYPDDSPKGTMAYIDVVGVSSWLYKNDSATYYAVEDAEGYLYTVRLSADQYKAMSEQQEYWDRLDDNVTVPAAYHLEGYVQDVSTEVRQNLADVWGITEEEYKLYFGERYLNATTSVGEENSAVWIVGAVFSGTFLAACLVVMIRAQMNAKKCLARLEERNLLEKAARQLEFNDSHLIIGRKRAILTQDFLFGKSTGAVVAFDDMLWIYRGERRRGLRVSNTYLMVGTAFANIFRAIDMNGADKGGYLGDAVIAIPQRNPNVLLGYSSENRKAYRDMLKNR